jgi:CubicO group peptidase (beta-lactamase class C family)
MPRNRLPLSLASVFLPALFLTSVFLAGAPAQQSRPSDPLRSYLESSARFGFSGSVLVAKGGKVVLSDGFGLADREKKVRCTKDTLFEIASATKPFTAVAVLQLEADGKLSSSDPIGKHLPGVPAGFEGVTIHHLLTHTSGMPRSAGSGRGPDLQAAVAAYLSVKPARQPGAAYEYWNGGYALLAGIVERASGGSYMDWCRKRIFEPAGMKSSGFTGDALDQARVAVGHDVPGTAPRRATDHPYDESYGWHYRGMGGLVTSVEDFYRFDRALRDDTLLPAKAREKLFKPALEGYACGFQVTNQPRRRVGHGGSVRGFHCDFARYPDDDTCIVVLLNGVLIPPFVIEEILRSLLLGTPTRYAKPPPTVDWPADKLEALAGSYESSPGERIVVRVADGCLRLGAEGPATMRELSTSAFGAALAPADPAFIERARTIVRALSNGDVGPLGDRLAPGIPGSWPARVKTSLWPDRTASLGALSGVRCVGSIHQGASTTILLALDFDRGGVRLKVVFKGDLLQIFDLHGPDFLADAFAAPAPDGRLVRYHWQGAPAAPISVTRDSSGRPTALRFESSGTPVIYKRLSSK